MEVREMVERLLESGSEKPVWQKADERVGEIVLLMAGNATSETFGDGRIGSRKLRQFGENQTPLGEWVELVFNSDVGRDYFAGASKQTTNLASINMTQLRSFPLPIPPVEEQQRILDALAALTDWCGEWQVNEEQIEEKRTG